MSAQGNAIWPTIPNWDVPHVKATQDFNFELLLAERMRRQEVEMPCDDLFDLSPLTSPESTPPASPTSTHSALPSLGPSLSTSATDRQSRKRAKNTAYRQKKRAEAKQEYFGNPPTRDKAKEKYEKNSQPLFTTTDIPKTRIASTGYVALNNVDPELRVYSLEELVGESSKWKFQLFNWDGRSYVPIVDKMGRIIGILAGQPDDGTWTEVQKEAVEALQAALSTSRVSAKKANHRRGRFKTLRCGYSHGGGQTHPQNLANSRRNATTLENLNSTQAFKRIAGFGSSVLAHRAPDLHTYYVEKLRSLEQHDPELRRPFEGSVFPSTTYNLGPRTACHPHIDFANLPFGLCAITALGSFDSKKGGHLVLWDCGLVIQFPPGATILIPSSVVIHSNTGISSNETRYSCTQYAAGGLFRWVDHGFKKVDDFRASLNDAELEELDRKHANRWQSGLALFPQLPWATPRR